MNEWNYIKKSIAGEKQIGPLSNEQFRELVQSGEISLKTRVNHPTVTNGLWVNAAEVPMIASAIEAMRKQQLQSELAKKEQKKADKVRQSRVKEESRQQMKRVFGPSTSVVEGAPVRDKKPRTKWQDEVDRAAKLSNEEEWIDVSGGPLPVGDLVDSVSNFLFGDFVDSCSKFILIVRFLNYGGFLLWLLILCIRWSIAADDYISSEENAVFLTIVLVMVFLGAPLMLVITELGVLSLRFMREVVVRLDEISTTGRVNEDSETP